MALCIDNGCCLHSAHGRMNGTMSVAFICTGAAGKDGNNQKKEGDLEFHGF